MIFHLHLLYTSDVSCCCSCFGVTVSHVVMPANDYTLEYFRQQHPEAVAHVVIFLLLWNMFMSRDEKTDDAMSICMHLHNRRHTQTHTYILHNCLHWL